jgi:DnaK suppressor protein
MHSGTRRAGHLQSYYASTMDAARARDLLAAERARLGRLLAGAAHVDNDDSADRDDPANTGTDLYQDEYDEGLGEDLREQLAAVERAEARLAAGTYGLSVESGEPIPDERLEAVPTAERTIEEERAREGG